MKGKNGCRVFGFTNYDLRGLGGEFSRQCAVCSFQRAVVVGCAVVKFKVFSIQSPFAVLSDLRCCRVFRCVVILLSGCRGELEAGGGKLEGLSTCRLRVVGLSAEAVVGLAAGEFNVSTPLNTRV